VSVMFFRPCHSCLPWRCRQHLPVCTASRCRRLSSDSVSFAVQLSERMVWMSLA